MKISFIYLIILSVIVGSFITLVCLFAKYAIKKEDYVPILNNRLQSNKNKRVKIFGEETNKTKVKQKPNGKK